MPLEQLANIAEVFGMIIVAVTLIFLTVQMRQNTSMLRSAATQGAHERISVMYEPLISDPSLTEIFLKGMDDPSKLSAVEVGRFVAWWSQAFFVVQNWYFQTRNGFMDDELLNGFSLLMTDMFQKPGMKSVWEQRKYMFAPEFVKFLDDEVFSRSPSPGYQVFGLVEEQL